MLIYLDNCCYNRPYDIFNQILGHDSKLCAVGMGRQRNQKVSWEYHLGFKHMNRMQWR